MRWASWSTVRGIGRLAILTRASMWMVIVVPIIAGIWPVVPYGTAVFSGSLAKVESLLDQAKAALHQNPQSSAAVDEQIAHLETIKTASSGRMPITFGLLFFAALAVLLGHSCFDWQCPESVKGSSRDDFVQLRKRQFVEPPSHAAVAQALDLLKDDRASETERTEEQEHIAEWRKKQLDLQLDLQEAIEDVNDSRNTLRTWPTTQMPITEQATQALALREKEIADIREQLRAILAPAQGALLRRQVGLIGRAAEVEYDTAATTNPRPLNAALVLYSLALILIALVVLIQSWSVIRASVWGWSSPAAP